VKGREARSAAERGHGQDAPSSTSERTRTGLVAGARNALEAFSELGRRLTVIRGFDRLRVSTDPGLASPGVGVRVAECNRDGWAPGVARGKGTSRPLRVAARQTVSRTVVERTLEGENPRRAPTGGSNLARLMGSSLNGLPGGARLRSGRAGR